MCITNRGHKKLNNCWGRPEAVGKDNIGYAHTNNKDGNDNNGHTHTNNKENNITSNGSGQHSTPPIK